MSDGRPKHEAARRPLFLRPDEGRRFDMGRIQAVFKADGDETSNRCSISEWWLDANTKGPGAHSHDEDDLFYVLEGTVSFLLQGRWVDAPRGSFVLAPAGMKHDFENRTDARAGMLNISVPGGFEEHMPSIAEWFRQHPPENAK